MKVFPETEYKNNSEMAEKATEKDSTKESEKTTAKKGTKTTAKKTTTKSTVKEVPEAKASEKKEVKKASAKKTTKTSKTEKNSVKEVSETQAEVVQPTLEVVETNENVAEAEKKESIKADTESQDTFLENFNWHNYQEGIEAIEDEQLKVFEKLVQENFVNTGDDDVVEGEVVYMTDREAIIDINAKSEGVISLNEFRYNPDLKVGDKVEVIIDTREDRTGQLVLSHRKARVIKAWDRVNHAHENNEIVNGFIKCRTKGGMIVDVFGIEAFFAWLTN